VAGATIVTAWSFSRLSDAPPPLREVLDVADDGTFTMWRSVGEIVGRFAGSIPGAAAAGALAADAASAEPPATLELAPDTTVDTVTVGGRTMATTQHRRPDGPWGELLALGRELLDALVDRPAAAIAASLPSPTVLRLEHRGDGTLPVLLGGAVVDVRVWSPTDLVAQVFAEPPDAGQVEVGPGWFLEVPLPELALPAGTTLAVDVSFVADDGGVLVPMVARATRRATG
jgi:hypothetical protein